MEMNFLLTGAEMASCDAVTSEVIGIPSLVLMERAALSVADGVDVFLRKNSDQARHRHRPVILAVAGRGNNGADALAAGRILLDRGYDVRFCRLSGNISPESSFAVQKKILEQYGMEVELYPDSSLCSLRSQAAAGGTPSAGLTFRDVSGAAFTAPDVIIDGLFGTGLSRNLTGEAAECVEAVNCCRDLFGTYVVAVDIPSGISSDDGRVMGCAIRCDETRTFAFYKRGHFLHPGTVYAGACHLAQIGITERAFTRMPGMFTLRGAHASELLPARNGAGNKGTFGKVLIVAGRRNMCGAALLAARACMASGAGMVKLFTHEANRLIIQQQIPEALLDTFTDDDTPLQAAERLGASLAWADIVAAGPAMGTDETGAALLHTILQWVQERSGAFDRSDTSAAPGRIRGLVLDADALRLIASDDSLRSLLAARPARIPCILTPHLAEFAALAGRSVRDCIEDRAAIVQEQADRLRCTIACKDARTLAARPSPCKEDAGSSMEAGCRQYLNITGNSGMAAAGSGDVLTGITAAFLALDFHSQDTDRSSPVTAAGNTPEFSFSGSECDSGFAAAVCAVYLHGRAGDLARQVYGEQSMKAGDLIGELRRASFWQNKYDENSEPSGCKCHARMSICRHLANAQT